MENATVYLLSNLTVLTAVIVGAGVLLLVYILKLIRKDEGEIVQKPRQKPKNENTHSETRMEVPHSGKTKKKVAENRWTTRNEKQAYSDPWLLTTLKGHTGSILDMDFSSNGKYLTSCGDEDPDPDGLESSSSSSEGNKESLPSTQPTPRSEGLSRRQRKNRRKEPTMEKCKKNENGKLCAAKPVANKHGDMEMRLLLNFVKFPSPCDVFEKLLRTYLLTPEQLLMSGYPVETEYNNRTAVIYNDQRSLVFQSNYKKTKFDVNAREFIPRYDSSDSGQGSSSSSESGDYQDWEESLNACDEIKESFSNLQSSYSPTSFKRTCSRCSSSFYTTDKTYITREKCIYHWGRLQYGQEYNCCGGAEDSPGCAEGDLHVWNGVEGGTNGPFMDFVATKPKRSRWDGTYGVYAVDCEMCYTVRGLECTKISVVDMKGKLVYDCYVRPELEIIDYNTRFSGILPEHINEGTRTLREVQEDLFHFINENTVLIGHGLENDLRALRIVHGSVVDTAICFPHPRGMPFRRSLKSLASDVLEKNVQCDESGHNSYEDACTCMELMLWKVRKDFREYLESRSDF